MELLKLMTFILIFQFVNSELNRPIEEYQSVIINVYNDHKCNSVILFGGNLNEEVNAMMELENLQLYFNRLHKQTTIVKKNIKLNSNQEFRNAKKPLVVFFDDSDDVKFQLIASAIDISKSIWLFFFSPETKIENFFRNIYFSYECKFIVSQKKAATKNDEIISEINLANEGKKIEQTILAKWNKETGIQSFTLDDNNLSSRTLRAATYSNPPLSIFKRNNDSMEMGGYLGAIIEIWQNELGFKFIYQEVDDLGLNVNGTWTGGIGLLMNDTVDIYLTPLVHTLERSAVAAFTIPILMTKLGMFIKKNDKVFSWNSYLRPFDITVWGAIVCTIILAGITTSFVKYFKKINVIWRLRKRATRSVKYIESFLHVYGAMCGQALEPSVFNPMRILQFTIHLTALVVLTFYSAVFLSILTTPEYKPPFSTFEDFLKDGSYKMGCIRGAPWAIFENSKDKAMQTIFRTHIVKQNPPPATLDIGHVRMCREDKYAFITFDILAFAASSKECTFVPLKYIQSSNLGITLQRNSPLLKVFNSKLLKMKENGVLRKLQGDKIPAFEKIDESWSPIDMTETVSIIFVLLGCMSISVILLVLEILISKKNEIIKKKLTSRI